MKERPPEYDKYIKSAQWRNICALLKKQARFLCQDCGRPSQSLSVHHLTYDRFGHERMSDLRVLCTPCHDAADEVREAEVQARNQQAFDDACEDSSNRAYDTYMTKKHGEDYYLVEDEYSREKFEAWREKKEEREWYDR